MKKISTRILAATFFAVGIVSFFAGAIIFESRAKKEKGELAMGALMMEISALGYLEKGDVKNSHQMLRMAIENNLLLVSKYDSPILGAHIPGSKTKWLTRYAEIRSKYPPIDYRDDGSYNKKIDAILSSK